MLQKSPLTYKHSCNQLPAVGITTRPSLPRMAQASFSTAARSRLLPALRDDGQDVRVPREAGCRKRPHLRRTWKYGCRVRTGCPKRPWLARRSRASLRSATYLHPCRQKKARFR